MILKLFNLQRFLLRPHLGKDCVNSYCRGNRLSCLGVISGKHNHLEICPVKLGDRITGLRLHGICYRYEAGEFLIHHHHHHRLSLGLERADVTQGIIKTQTHFCKPLRLPYRDLPAVYSCLYSQATEGSKIIWLEEFKPFCLGLVHDGPAKGMLRSPFR